VRAHHRLLLRALVRQHRGRRLAGLDVAAAWPAAPRPVPATALLPERAIAGDPEARATLADIHRLLATTDTTLVETLSAYIDAGGALETTARALFVHPNTVRYRLRRVADLTGFAPTDPRDRWALSIGLTLGRLTLPAAGDNRSL